jgi:methylmalonyl-CoA mutase C-terminal domain/subunit
VTEEKKIKVLLGKVGLDGHDRGIRTVASWLREEGMEVIYIGMQNTPETVIATAIQEDVDVIGMSFQGGDHIHLLKKAKGLMKEKGMDEVLLVAGGNIPRQHDDVLKEAGVDAVFHPGTMMDNIVSYIKENVKSRQN